MKIAAFHMKAEEKVTSVTVCLNLAAKMANALVSTYLIYSRSRMQQNKRVLEFRTRPL